MALRVNTNIAAMNAYRNLTVTDGQMSKSLEKLSSGFRINRAADDAAGLSISEGLRSQIGGLKVASRNAQDGVSVVQIAEGALSESHAILQRMRDLAVQASSTGSQDSSARTAANTEVQQLTAELTRISSTTKFGSQQLLNGSFTGTFQVGANAGETIDVNSIGDMSASGLGVTGLDLVGSASAALASIDTAISTVSSTRSTLGAFQNRFEHAINNINVSVENLSASESRIRDTDMAEEMTKFTRNQILSQAGTSMLSQANQSSQGVLSLLK
ncbi:flagellin [Motilibacter peucedani]|uniref:Flagellin n=1 Tax=Motilibacter peucedani TaxID=598650 RepID=A0A420XTS1_9ACTN|nr:flagellin [Motilibacter peucedani]RKS80150.1 flagellin [Motilibacter peucedani]